MGPISVPCALDRTAWWPVIQSEKWDARTAMTLLGALEDALFGAHQETEEADDDD